MMKIRDIFFQLLAAAFKYHRIAELNICRRQHTVQYRACRLKRCLVKAIDTLVFDTQQYNAKWIVVVCFT